MPSRRPKYVISLQSTQGTNPKLSFEVSGFKAEKVLDKPVISSNQAISWQMLREAGINSTAGPGILFSKH